MVIKNLKFIIRNYSFVFCVFTAYSVIRRGFTLFCCLLLTATITAQPPVANFTNNDSTGCDNLPVNFTDLSTNNPTSWQWNFGNGQTSTLQNPSVLYTTPGIYTVTLIVANAFGSDTIIKTNLIKVYQSPTANFSANPTEGCLPLTVNFTDQTIVGDTNIISWTWDFGDGGSSTSQNPAHTYTASGTYQASLEVIDANGCSDVSTSMVTVMSVPTANFSGCASAGSPPYTANFTNTSTGANQYFWNFGDGSTSTQQNPSHTYTSSGSFDVTLIACNTATSCCDTIIQTNCINITTYYADFTYANTTGCNSVDVQFTDQSAAGTISWQWDFGDGGTSNLQNPTHTYTSSGNYTVMLIASNGPFTDTVQKIVNVTVYPLPAVNFSANDTASCTIPFTVNFTASAPTATSYLWFFGDGGWSTAQNPSYTYNNYGNYTVTLQVTDANGCQNAVTKFNYINIYYQIVDFGAIDTNGCKPLTVNFIDSSYSPYPITNWFWNFGDGFTSTQQNPQHTYNDTGSYTVTLTIIDAQGCTTSYTIPNYIAVGIPPVADFSATPTISCHPLTVQFTDNSSPYANEWIWLFGDGTYGYIENPTHTYNDTGYFDVTLVALHNGCPDTIVKDSLIYVYPPRPQFSATPTISCTYPVTVQFTDLSWVDPGDAVTWQWDFGDGSPPDYTQNPTHTYTQPGFYSVELVVTANNPPLCADSITMYNYIQISEIIPGFYQSDTIICQYSSITFYDTSYANTSITDWAWYFGDGTFDTSCTSVCTHQYTAGGTYSIELVVTDALGCKDSITKTTATVQGLPTVNFTGTPTDGCVPLTVTFDPSGSSAIPPATLTQWTWDFGDGSYITVNNPNPVTHTYDTISYPGSFHVTLTVCDSRGCCNTLTKWNYITPTKPYPSFTHPSLICHYDSVQFTNTSQGCGMTYEWDFGDGSPINTNPNPTHQYIVDTTTSFTVTLTVTDSNGCDSSYSSQIIVSHPIANFYSSDTVKDCPPMFVQFYDTSSADVVSWSWNFGDPQSGANNYSDTSSPQHAFWYAQPYTVTLIVTNSAGCSDTMVNDDYLVNGPYGSFDYIPKEGCKPLEVTFFATTQNADSTVWFFGDGGTGSGDTITHIYSDTGTYTPALWMQDQAGCIVTLVGDTDIVVNSVPIADFSFTTACEEAPIYFTDSSKPVVYPITSWSWDFGDGSPISNQQNPAHIFSDGGFYNVTLTVTDINGCSDTITQNVEVYYKPDVDFSFSGLCLNDTTFFADSTTVTNSTLSAWQWDFGDGGTSTQQNPSHYYSSAGDYNVTLTVTSAHGCLSDSTQIVHINYLPQANFNFQDSACSNENISFTDASLNPPDGVITSWQWDFGNGSTSTLQNPQTIYSVIGPYEITLIVTTQAGCKDTLTDTILIFPKPVANFTNTEPCFGNPTVFTDNSSIQTGSIVSWLWDFGDTATSNESNPTHLYSTDGVFNGTLIISSDFGCSDTITKQVVVHPIPVADFNMSSNCALIPIQFTDVSTIDTGAITSWQWNFGDGTTSTSQNPTHTYNFTDTTFTITLIVTSQYGCVDTTDTTVNISPYPVALFFADTTNGCTPFKVNFTDSSTIVEGSIISWQWYFSDGAGSSEQNPSHTFNNGGNYTVTLTVTSNCGLTDAYSMIITAYNTPIANFNASTYYTNLENTTISFYHNSTNFTDLLWYFGDGDTSILLNPEHTYQDTGVFNVTLIATNNPYGCSDTITKQIYIEGVYYFQIPNAFTPNGDGINDVFNAVWLPGSVTEYRMYIFNRWGQIIFESDDKYEGWDGTTYNEDIIFPNKKRNEAPQGVYVYLFVIKSVLGDWYRYIGRVTLIR